MRGGVEGRGVWCAVDGLRVDQTLLLLLQEKINNSRVGKATQYSERDSLSTKDILWCTNIFNLQEEDNLLTKGKIASPNVSGSK